jgi:hypothetical protein
MWFLCDGKDVKSRTLRMQKASRTYAMDLEISGRRAIVCASSRGLERACAQALAAAGDEAVIR